MTKRLIAAACLLLAACSTEHRAVSVSGRVLGHDGKPMQAAWASVQGQGFRERFRTDGKGNLSVVLPKRGAYFIWVVGVHHQSLVRPLLVDEGQRVSFEARLRAAPCKDSLDSVQVIGSFNGFSTDEGTRLLQRQPDGTFAGTIEARADTFAYQLLGVQPDDVPIEGTLADGYISLQHAILYQGHAGAFVSILRSQGDSARVTFDPRALPRSESAESFQFGEPKSRAARVAAAAEFLSHQSERFSAYMKAVRAAGQDTDTIQYDWSRDRAELRERIERESDPVVQHYLLLQYFATLAPSEADSLLAQRILAEVPPSSHTWSLLWGGPAQCIFSVCRLANRPEAARAYNLRAADQHPDEAVRAAFLLHEVQQAFAAMKKERPSLANPETAATTAAEMEFSILYGRLQTEFAGSRPAQMAKKQMGPERRIQPGNRVPDFAVTSLDDSSVTITPELLGKRVYLIDFWAVWCGPCVGEMSYLDAAYRKYEKHGFTILSVSFDRAPHDVAMFRRDRWTMPWLHGFATGGFRSELAQQFEVIGIPRTILVDETGKILAVDLRGEGLEKALAEVFAATLQRQRY